MICLSHNQRGITRFQESKLGLPIGTVNVASAGTRVQVVSSGNAVSAVSFRARTANTGAVYVGDDTVASGSGYELQPGDVVVSGTPGAILGKQHKAMEAGDDCEITVTGLGVLRNSVIAEPEPAA